VTAITWRQNAVTPNAWSFYHKGQCIATVQPQLDTDGFWRVVIQPRPGQQTGLHIDHCPSLEQAKAVISRELRHYWPEVVG